MDKQQQGQVNLAVPVKKTKLLHFSDGVEEVTDSEDDVDHGSSLTPPEPTPTSTIDESTMDWVPWLLLKSKQTGETLLSGCDYVGEVLASALGITSPKFLDAEEELRKAVAEQKERDEEAAEEIREMGEWKVDSTSTNTTTTPITEPLTPSPILLHDESEKPQVERY